MKKTKDTLAMTMAMGTLFIVWRETKKMIAIGQGGDGKRFHMPHFRRPKIKQISIQDFNPFRDEGGRG